MRVISQFEPGRRSANSLAAGVLLGGFDSPEPSEWVLEAIAKRHLAGVTLFRRNIRDVEQCLELNRALHAAAPVPIVVAVDQEGGRVARLRERVLGVPAMRKLGDRKDPTLTRQVAEAMGRQLRGLGFTLDFAPVLDIDTNPANPIIGDRAFGRDAETVIRHACEVVLGFEAVGLAGCGKHFPGHGDTELDSHLALPRLLHSRERLDAVELAPFRALAKLVPSIMTAHVIFDAFDPKVPATLSPFVIEQLLRGELGYEGIVFSDDLEMKAIADHFGIGQAACLAIEAGCDAILVCEKRDNMERVIDSLAERATQDPVFYRRLERAYDRFLLFRQRYAAAPVTADELAELLAVPDVARELNNLS